MAKTTDILLEAGTNEVEIVVFVIEEAADPNSDQENGSAPYEWRFGVNVAKVLEIIRLPSYTELPEPPHPSVLGAFNLRNRVIPLVDLGAWLGIPGVQEKTPKVLVTEFNKVITAFKVSAVDRIHRLSWERIEPPNEQLSSFSEDSLTGVVRMEKEVILILDLEKIVAELNPRSAMRIENVSVLQYEKRYRALIVDDSVTVRRLIQQQLEQANYEVEIANNGRIGWDWLKDKKERCAKEGRPITDFVHVVISDIEMPGMDGHSLTKHIKGDPALCKLPVILFSSLISESLQHKGVAVGADLQVAKPDLGIVANAARDMIHKAFGAI
jgi:two-component system chemotaxis response regulator CheV